MFGSFSILPQEVEKCKEVTEAAYQDSPRGKWLGDIRARHPFAKMSKQEILEVLRRTRETVWAERHAG